MFSSSIWSDTDADVLVTQIIFYLILPATAIGGIMGGGVVLLVMWLVA